MIKTSWLILLICFALSCAPVLKPYEYPKPFEFVLVDNVQGSKQELYARANVWLAKRYSSSKNVIQMSDKEAGTLVGKAVGCRSVNYTIMFEIKDNKYRCTLSDFYHEGSLLDDKGWYGKTSVGNLNKTKFVTNGRDYSFLLHRVKNCATDYSKELLQDLKEYMNSKPIDF